MDKPTLSITAEYMRVSTPQLSAQPKRTIGGFPDPLIPLTRHT